MEKRHVPLLLLLSGIRRRLHRLPKVLLAEEAVVVLKVPVKSRDFVERKRQRRMALSDPRFHQVPVVKRDESINTALIK